MKNILQFAIAVLITLPSYAKCSWDLPPTDIVFGTYSVFSSSVMSMTGNYRLNCTPNTNTTITFTVGQNASNYTPRFMAYSGNNIGYNVYDDVTGNILGDGTGGTTQRVYFNSSPGNKIYADNYIGKVTQGADVVASAAGTTYTDVVTILVTWAGGSLTGTFNVTAVVLAECQMSASPLAFNSYDPVVLNATNPLDATSSISVTCTKGTSGTITLDNGLNFASTGRRSMSGPASSFLNYDLYSDTSRTTPWASVGSTSLGKASPITLTIFGRVPGAQDPAAGAYSDTMQAAINY